MEYPASTALESSSTARAFDANISIADHGQSLFYVVARAGTPDAAVHSVGGEIVGRLTVRKALALAPLALHATLRNHPDLELAGPITIDPERFARFTRLLGLGETS
jgi:hypothetical protein